MSTARIIDPRLTLVAGARLKTLSSPVYDAVGKTGLPLRQGCEFCSPVVDRRDGSVYLRGRSHAPAAFRVRAGE
jgi:hypothetical protein